LQDVLLSTQKELTNYAQSANTLLKYNMKMNRNNVNIKCGNTSQGSNLTNVYGTMPLPLLSRNELCV